MTVPDITIRVNGSIVTTRVRFTPATIHDLINDAVDTCEFLMDGTAPTTGQTVRITTSSDTRLLFNGSLTAVTMTYEGKKTQLVYQCVAQDDSFSANALRPFGIFENVSASTVATSIVADFAPTFTTTNVQAALPAISVIFDGSEGMDGCLRQIAKLVGGYFYWSDGDLHLFTAEASDLPDDIDDTPGSFLQQPPISITTDRTRLWTRVYGKGHGDPVKEDTAAGSTELAIDAPGTFFSTSGGQAIVGAQRLTYTGLRNGFETTSISADWLLQFSNTSNLDILCTAYSPSLDRWVQAGVASVYTSDDNTITWTSRTASWTGQAIAACWSPELTLFCLVTTSGEVETSPDGITWTSRTPSAANSWQGICWANTLGLFVAVAGSGTDRVMTSPNGTTWTARTAASNINWDCVAWSEDAALLVACAGASGASTIMTSTNGTAWTSRTSPNSSCAWFGVDYSPTLGLWLLGGNAASVGTGAITATSPDGTTWTANSALATPQASVVAVKWIADQDRFICAMSDARAFYTINGTAFTAQVLPISTGFYAMAYGNGVTLIVGSDGVNSRAVGNVAIVQPYGILTGIPPSGTGSITNDIPQGDICNIWVERNDLTAQGTYGIRESPPIVDERRNEDSLTALCDATLELFKAPIKTVRYSTRDLKTKSGKPVVINLANPPISETLTIQDVTIRNWDLSGGPIFDVEASTLRFSLEDVFRRLLTGSSRNV